MQVQARGRVGQGRLALEQKAIVWLLFDGFFRAELSVRLDLFDLELQELVSSRYLDGQVDVLLHLAVFFCCWCLGFGVDRGVLFILQLARVGEELLLESVERVEDLVHFEDFGVVREHAKHGLFVGLLFARRTVCLNRSYRFPRTLPSSSSQR